MRPDAQGLRRCRPAMGTFVEVSVLDPAADTHGAAIDAAFAAIDRVQSLMSFHDPASDLSRLNAAAHDGPVRVDPWTLDVLAIARRLFDGTDGRFDCAVGFDLIELGVLPGPMPSRDARRGSFADVVLCAEGTVRFDAPLCLDLGGIAKGYAVDRAVDALRTAGIASGVVNAGGDLRVLGDVAVPVHVRRGDDLATLTCAGVLADGAFATSTPWRARASGPSQAASALIDPRRRRPVDGAWHDTACAASTRHDTFRRSRTPHDPASRGASRHYSIIAPQCAIADGLTKALAVAGRLDDACLRRFDAVQLVH